MTKKAVQNCEYLVNNRLCGALSEDEEGKNVRDESCTNELKNFCCYLCNLRYSCEISCNYLDKVTSPTIPAFETTLTSETIPPSQTCGRCGTVNKLGSKFCKKCGATFQISETCPKCGSKLDSDAIFCQECGSKIKSQWIVAPSGLQRRLPFGLELLIALGTLGSLFYFGSSIMAFWAASTVFEQADEISRILAATGVLWMLLALCQITVSWGLWKLQEWARKAVVLLAILNIIGAFLNPIYGITGLVFSVIVLVYLYTSHVDSLFRSDKVEECTS